MEEDQNHTVEQQRAILENVKLQALHNFQIGLHEDIKLLVRSQRYQTLQEAIAGRSAEEKVRNPNPKGSQYPRGKTETGRTQNMRNPTVQCHKCRKTEHYGRVVAPAATPTDLRCLRRINIPK